MHPQAALEIMKVRTVRHLNPEEAEAWQIIITACNSHDALVDALEECVDHVTIREMADKARAALKQAQQ